MRRRNRYLAEWLEHRRLLADVTWDGGAGTEKWTDANNWSTNQIPGPADRALINAPGATVRVDNFGQTASVGSLSVNAGCTLIVSATLALQDTGNASIVNGNLMMSGTDAVFYSNHELIVFGTLEWFGGTIRNTDKMTFRGSAARLNFSSAAGHYLASQFNFEIGSATTFTSAVTLYFGSTLYPTAAGRFAFADGAKFDVLTNLSFQPIVAHADHNIHLAGDMDVQPTGFVAMGVPFQLAPTGSLSLKANTLYLGTGAALSGAVTLYPGTTLETNGNITFTGNDGSLIGGGKINAVGGDHVIEDGFQIQSEVELSAGSMTFNTENALSKLTLFGLGRLIRNAPVTITDLFSFTGGSLLGTGNLIADADSVVSFTGTGAKTLTGAFINYGEVSYSGSNLVLGAPATAADASLVNAIGGSMTFAGNGDLAVNGSGTRLISNAGTLIKNGASTITTFSGVPFTNSGLLNIPNGTLQLPAGGSSLPGLNGNIEIAVPGTLQFLSSTFNIQSAATISGRMLFSAGSTVTVSHPDFNAAGELSLAGGTLNLDDAGTLDLKVLSLTSGTLDCDANLSVSQTCTWSGGTLAGGGSVTLESTCTTTVSGSSTKKLDLPCTNDGTLNYTGSNLTIEDSVLTNTGTCTMNTAGDILPVNGGTCSLVNSGTINKQNNSETLVSIPYFSVGTTNVMAGTLSFSAGTNIATGAPLSTGSYVVSTGATLLLGGFQSACTASVTIHPSANVPHLTSLSTLTGAIHLASGTSWTLTPAGGTLNLAGTLDVAQGSVLNVTDNVNVTSACIFSITLAPTNTHGKIAVSGTLDLSTPNVTTTIDADLVAGFDPPLATVFPVITAGSILGAIDVLVAPPTPSGLPLYHYGPDLQNIALRVEEAVADPVVISSFFRYDTEQTIYIEFDQVITSQVERSDIVIRNVDTGAILPNHVGTFSYGPDLRTVEINLTNQLPDANWSVELSLSDGDADGEGKPFLTFFTLRGDANRDRAVNFDDLLIVAQNYGQTGRNLAQGNLDYSASGSVNFDDLLMIAQRYGTTLNVAVHEPILKLDRVKRDRHALEDAWRSRLI